jgi:hypothetical protein
MPKEQPEELEAKKRIKDGCTKAKKGPVSFFYCTSGPDGKPVLLVGKRIQAKTKPIIKKAKEKKFIRGKLLYKEGAFVFQSNKPKHARFKKHLRDVFGKMHPPLKTASVVAIPVDDEGGGGLQTELQHELQRRKLRRERQAAEKSDGRSDDFWFKRHQEVELGWGDKLDIVSAVEEKIAARLEDGRTSGVLERLDKNQDRIERLLQQARKLLAEVRR